MHQLLHSYCFRSCLPALLVAVASAGSAARATAQGAASGPASVSQLTCAQANAMLVNQATGHPPDAAFLRPRSRSDADAALRILTYSAIGSPRCPADYGVRALLKWYLSTTDWVPKDAPGQRPGIPWNLDAIYDLAEAGKQGGPSGAVAATIATQYLLTDVPALPFAVREVGPALLEAFAAPAPLLADSIRQFQRGRLASWLWRPALADTAFSAYAAAGGGSDRAAVELARVRLALGAPGADSLYYQAARSADTAVVRELRHDIAWIADSSELAGFDSTTPATREAWLRDFWEERDVEALRPHGSRLAEHYRRVGFAKEHFRLLVMDRKYELNELWVNRLAPFDDRGLIYIRHGEPDDTAAAVRAGACPNVSWLYRRAEGNLIFHFVARENPNDWRLVETLANVSGEAGATTRVRRAGTSRSCAVIDDLIQSRAALDPIYAKLVASPTYQNWERELTWTTRSRKVGTTTDSDPLRFAKQIDAAWRTYALLGDAPGQGKVLIVSSLPASALQPIIDDPPGYGFQLHFVAASGDTVIETDSTRRFRAQQELEPGQMLTFTTEMGLRPGTWNFGSVLRQPVDSAGQFFRTPALDVPDPGSTTLQMSDIVLGAEAGGLSWQAPDGPFMLSPTGTYTRGEPVLVFYELAGARAGETLKTDVTFAREEGGDETTLSFSEQAGGAVDRLRRAMATDRLKVGRYTLRVTVRSEDGSRTATRETAIYVVRPAS
ncbi:MAG TPA: GWxTD domain-containing protein [Gemmatimonadales bacterium]|nr:GWxTD domain-containing protein [Gemmatimonadales bacterium]